MKRYLVIMPLLISLPMALLAFRDLVQDEGHRASWRVKEKETQSRLLEVPILLYHNIDGKGVFSLTSETMRAHFELFRRKGIRIISLKELDRRLEEGTSLEEKCAVISFDDGFQSMYTKLLPLVREYGYPVTLFVYLDFIHERSSTALTWENLREMDSSGIDIQCHTISHGDLTGQVPDAVLYREMNISRRILGVRLGKEVDYLAFPYGRYDRRLVALAEDCGYRRVFSTDYGSNVITRDNFCLRRHHIKNTFSLEYISSLVQ